VLLELLAQEKARQLEEDIEEQEGAAAEAAAALAGLPETEAEVDPATNTTTATTSTVTKSRLSESPPREPLPQPPLYARKPRSSFTSSLPFASNNSHAQNNAKMDVTDFVR
jgi:hypothetical protein